ncbi:methylated-DNA--[protein]-cysteine S-methyltransferase [Arthrobacter sp. KK5.5]|uniref:methylated-DNA--[protein]-cysteine S-methyltransferase n=1 Tax=Arthrobacter sp. KK5.5 TaxID=3373084 RepID=UPI003EE529AF
MSAPLPPTVADAPGTTGSADASGTPRFDAELAALLSATAETADVAGRLHRRLVEAAAAAGALDVAYRVVDTPVGSLLLATTETGLVRVAFAQEDHDAVLQQLASRLSPRILRAPARLDDAARQLDEYFSGTRHEFDLRLDRTLSSGYRREIHEYLPLIPYGQTASYAQIALATGRPKAVRAVGTACATNPLPVVVPCHRVLRSDGTLGGYLGGTEAKTRLLGLESAA